MSSLILALTYLAIASLAQASPSYEYATGDKLRLQIKPGDFVGIKDLFTLSQRSSPLNLSSVTITNPSPIKKNMQIVSIEETEDYTHAFHVSASIQGSYGGISGSASANYVQSQTLTSTSSLYMMFFEMQLGDVFINPDARLSETAETLLLKDPSQFVKIFGLYYIYGATIGCQASSTITITAKSEEEKKSVDAAAQASYQSMFSGSSNFSTSVESTKGFKSMSVSAFTKGGSVSALANTIDGVRTKILEPLDSGAACSSENAAVLRALIRSWMSLPAIATLASKKKEIIQALTPQNDLPPSTLRRMNDVIMRSKTLLKQSEKCHQNVFSCSTKQWNEKTSFREEYYARAERSLTEFQNDIDNLSQVQLNPDIVLQYEKKLESIHTTYIKPAEALSAFKFTFHIRVLTWYDSYSDPPKCGTDGATGSFTIDPNYQDTIDQGVECAMQPVLDNGHHNCRHYNGRFHASFKANTLYVWQTWSRVCGSQNVTTEVKAFKPGGDTTGTTDYGSVRTIYDFSVTYTAQVSHEVLLGAMNNTIFEN